MGVRPRAGSPDLLDGAASRCKHSEKFGLWLFETQPGQPVGSFRDQDVAIMEGSHVRT
jgi:hypothetical protein